MSDSKVGSDDAALFGGYAMRVLGDERQVLRLEAPDGRVCLTISLHAGGAAVELAASSLRVATTGDVQFDCERLQVNARDRIDLVAGTDIGLAARLGNVDLVANDDVSLQGERIRLNSPETGAGAARAVTQIPRAETRRLR